MKNLIMLVMAAFTIAACSESESLLSVDQFSKAITLGNSQLVDVRTPGEYKSEHIDNAVNYDVNGDDFTSQIKELDKSKPVYVYCLSGGRSSSAAKLLRSNGFTQVFDLDGGMLAWTKANKPVVSKKVADKLQGTPAERQVAKSIANDTLTMIDFFAYWCGPCMKMKPAIDKLEKELHNDVEILSVDVDQEKGLSVKYGISAMPTLVFLKNNKEVHRVVGYQTEGQLRKVIAKYK